MIDLDFVIERIHTEQHLLAAQVSTWTNAGPSGQNALVVEPEFAVDLALFLRDDPELLLDYCSNVTGIDWPEGSAKASTMGQDEDTDRRPEGAHLEVVYHLYSVALRHGPLILRLRTADRAEKARLPSLTSVWKSAELQEREVYDLYGITFERHPDLRRILLWNEFEGHPMRKDYEVPDEEAPAGSETKGGAG
ncbi:MAG: NADH-quinone oxidoreductase subunit C [Opitutales bacterium]